MMICFHEDDPATGSHPRRTARIQIRSMPNQKLGIDTPYNDFVTDMVKAIQENYENQYK